MPTPAARRLDVALLALALVLASALAALDLTAPWEDGFKGTNGGAYTTRFVRNHLELGLGVTKGALVRGLDPRAPHAPVFYANHPATWTLLYVPVAAVFGAGEAVVRLVALLLYLPAVAAVWWLARRLLGAPAAGVCALLFATLPMAAYYGPMAAPDGPLLACFPLVAALFLAQVDQPTRARGLRLGAVFLFACLLDFTAAWLVPMLLLLVPLAADRRRALRVLAWLLLLGAAGAALLLAHTALALGGLDQAFAQARELVRFTQAAAPAWSEVFRGESADAVAWFGWPMLALAATGVILGLLAPRAWGLRRALWAAAALALPGLLNVLVFREHALRHAYWSLFATPGLALAAAVPFAAALAARREAASGASRRAGTAAVGLLALAGVLSAWTGAFAAAAATQRNATTFHRDIGRRLDHWFGPEDVVLSSVPLSLADLYAQATVLSPVSDPQLARELAALYAPPDFTGTLAFILPSRERKSPLAEALAQMAVPEDLPRAVLFRVRP